VVIPSTVGSQNARAEHKKRDNEKKGIRARTESNLSFSRGTMPPVTGIQVTGIIVGRIEHLLNLLDAIRYS